MRRPLRWLGGLLLAAAVAGAGAAPPPVRIVVIGGLQMCGVWPALQAAATKATGLPIETVAVGPKEQIVPIFRAGGAELLLMHGSDETFALQAAGLAAPLRAWGMNEHVIVGPEADPAGVAAASDGVDAMRRIIAADAPLLALRDPGSFAVQVALWRAGGLRPGARQLQADAGAAPHQAVAAAAERGAYIVVGHLPVAFGKQAAPGMRLLLHGDPAMRRVYVLAEPGPRHPADRLRRQRAGRLAAYLLGPAGQAALQAADRAAGGPWVYPLSAATP